MTNPKVHALLLAAAIGCGVTPPEGPKQPGTAATEDDHWQRSAYWLYATADSRSGHGAECNHVAQVLKKEETCKGALCKYGAELAAEWLEKCSELTPNAKDEVRDTRKALEKQATRSPSRCARELAHFMDEGCNPDDCEADAQEWATRCGGTEAGPLAVRILASVAERNIGDGRPVKLDARNCDTLRQDVAKAAHCANEEACKKAWSLVETHEKRCTDSGTIRDITYAMQLMVIATAAAKEPEPVEITVEPAELEKGAVPLMLEDGSGAVVLVCHKRVVDLDKYLQARPDCEGPVRILRAVEGERRMVQAIDVPAQTLAALDLLPSLVVTGERKQAEKELAKVLGEAIKDAISKGGTSGLALLVNALNEHAEWLGRSEAVRAMLTNNDAALAPLLEAAAQAKVAAGQAEQNVDVRRGLYYRARTRAFVDFLGADVNTLEGRPAGWLTTSALLPKASAAYDKALSPLGKLVKSGPKPDARKTGAASKAATKAAKACAAAQRTADQAVKDLLACIVGGCDEAQIAGFEQAHRDALASALTAQRQIDVALSESGGEKPSSVAAGEGCKLPTH